MWKAVKKRNLNFGNVVCVGSCQKARTKRTKYCRNLKNNRDTEHSDEVPIMKYFSTRGGGQLSFEEVTHIDPSQTALNEQILSLDRPHRLGPQWWPLHPRAHSFPSIKLGNGVVDIFLLGTFRCCFFPVHII